MKRILSAFCGFVLVTCVSQAAQTLTMATEATFPPYEFLRGQEVVGIDVEISKAVAQKLGREFRVENMDFDSVIPAVISGKANLAASGITITEDRKKDVDLSVPYVKTGSVAIFQKASPYTTPDLLKGKKIGVQSGTTSDTYVMEQLKQEPERFKSTPEACAAMLAGRCAFVIADIDPAKNCVKGEEKLALSDFLSSEEYAIAVAKGQPELLAAINETIAAVKADGRLEKWVADYTVESDKLKEVMTVSESATSNGLVAWLSVKWDALRDDFHLCFLKKAADGSSRGMYLVKGLGITLEVALSAIVFGLLLGFLIAVIRSSHDKYGYFPVMNALAKVYLTIIRGTPMVVQLLITYYIILRSVDSKVLIAILAFGINSGAYQAEIIRAGIASIDPGQMEAGRALGLPYAATMIKIIVPQAVKNILPTLGNEFIALVKDTSVASFVAAVDLYKVFTEIGTSNYEYLMPYLAMALIYIILVLLITLLFKLIEKQLHRSDRA